MPLTKEEKYRILSALKNGVVPKEGIRELCINREKELEEIKRCLSLTEKEAGLIKIIRGPYGAGKSFFLQLIKEEALNNNFVVSTLKINQGFRLNNLKHLYYNIMHNLVVLDGRETTTGFDDIFEDWIKGLTEIPREQATERIREALELLNKHNASFSRGILTYIRSRINNEKDLSNAIISWLSGEDNIPYKLKSQMEIIGTIDKTNSIDFLKAFIAMIKIAGYKGLVILIDELELIMNERVDIRQKSYENIRYIIDEASLGELHSCLFVFAATDNLFNNEEKGFQSYEALNQRLGNYPTTSSNFYDSKQMVMNLPSPRLEDFNVLTGIIMGIYDEVYSLEPLISQESLMNWTLFSCKREESDIFKLTMRQYIMKIIEILDIMVQYPDNKIFKSELQMINNDGRIIFRNKGLQKV